MADRTPLFLIFWTLIITGLVGAEETHVFCTAGETVHLPCKNTVHCSTSATKWNHNRYSSSKTVEQINLGEKKERLKLESNCSLTINKVTPTDAGLYTCQQWTGDQQQGNDLRVYLHVLAYSPSPAIALGLSLTLSCQLFSYSGCSCGDSVRSDCLQLSWENQAGVKLNTDSRYQISFNPHHCILSLNTTLLSGDDGQQWRCGLYQRNQLKTSFNYAVQYSVSPPTTHNLATETKPNTQDPQTEKPAETTKAGTQTAAVTSKHKTSTTANRGRNFTVFLFACVAATTVTVFIAAVLILILTRRAGPKRANRESVKQTEDVTYSEVTSAKKKRIKSATDYHDDSVIYAAVRTA